MVVSAQDNLSFSNFSAFMTLGSVMPVASTAISALNPSDTDLELLGDGSDTAHVSGHALIQLFAFCTFIATLLSAGSSKRRPDTRV